MCSSDNDDGMMGTGFWPFAGQRKWIVVHQCGTVEAACSCRLLRG
jgi:hypothetical protein